MTYVIATFEQSLFLEMAITALQQKGISQAHILAVPLDKRQEPRQLFDTIHRADGFSLLDLAAVLGTVFMLLGAIYGSVLAWGPIIWGIIGACGGLIPGFLIKYTILKRRIQKNGGDPKKITSEVVVMVVCKEWQLQSVEQTLWENLALGVSRIARPETAKNG
jgi:hypothetical protein